MGKNTLRVAILNAILLTGGTMLPLHVAHAQGQAQVYRIDAGDLESVLSRFGTQSRLQLIYPPELLAGKRSRGLTGSHTPNEGLRRLLEGTGLEAGRVNDSTVVIRTVSAPAQPSRPAARDESAGVQTPAEAEPQALSSITVTGSRIRGGSTPAPVITIGSERIAEEGFSDLGEVIRSLPQNFRGGQNPGVVGGATAGAGGLANQNLTGGSGLNLRGLGPDASLTLLNGRRMAYGGFVQAIDISAIPVEAVDRIEILPDGASAIYGSDAVGGVGNVILHRDYDGVAVGVRHGGATGGGLSTREYTLTVGNTWASGGLIAAYKDASVDAIYARQRAYTRHMADPTTLYPESDLRSGLLSLHQSLGDAVELRLDALRTERDQVFYPYNTSALPYYNVMTPESRATLVAPGIDIALDNDWTLQFGMSRGRDRLLNRQTRVALGTGVLTPRSNECFCNEIRSHEAGAEGPLFVLPGGDARLALGVGQRKNAFRQHSYLTNTTAIEGDESSRFAYAELNLPLVGADTNVAGVERLTLNLAARGEDYDSFGSVVTPKVGLIYGPNADLTFKASWGRAFKAPTLFQRYWARQVLLRSASDLGAIGYPADATVLVVGGGNADLGAERAKTWVASMVFHPQGLPGLEAELSWFDIDYTDRVVEPLANFSQALGNPLYDQFISYLPSLQEQQDLLASADSFFNLTGRPYDPATVVAIPYAHYTNVARQRVKGLDLALSYRVDLASGRLTIRGSGSWLDSSQQSTPGEDARDLAGTLFSPAALSSRLGAVWTRGGFSASGFVNHISGVTNTLVAGAREKTASFTTLDAALRYGTEQRNDLLSGIEFTLSAQNLLDRDPPFYTPLAAANPPYDSTNYSAIGRFVSLSVGKRF